MKNKQSRVNKAETKTPFFRNPIRALMDLAKKGLRDYEGVGNSSVNGSFPAAQFGRLVADWATNGLSADRVLDGNLKVLRDRARQLERSNSYMRRFLAELVANVLGASGILLNSNVRDTPGGKLDRDANLYLERRFTDWSCNPKWFDVARELNMHESQKIGLRSVARDGDYLIRMIRGRNAVKNDNNPWGFRLQFLEGDMLDYKYNAELPNGNKIRLGVEKDEWGRCVAYHIFTNNPGDYYWEGNRIRVPAEDIIHPYCRERFGQSRSFPWVVSAMRPMHMMEKYEEAELVAARVGAAKMGFYVPKTPEDWDGEIDGKGDLLQDANPGMFEVLPQGMDFKEYNPNHPNANLPGFRKEMLRSIASGILSSYNFLAQDFEGVNYTSLRASAMNEREIWKLIQVWYAYVYLAPLYPNWLEMGIISGQLALPMSKFDKFNSPSWKYRRWGWVDPLKEIQAADLAINSRVTSRARVFEASGDESSADYNALVEEMSEEQTMLEKAGIAPVDKPQPTKPTPDNPNGTPGGEGS